MSRFAANPKWIIYLPPTMSPCETSTDSDYLEHPLEAFDYYRKEGVAQAVCEEKHMGSRAVAIVCRDQDAARRRFGVREGAGICYTRTGRKFFDDEMETALIDRIRKALDATDFWKEFQTDWVCLDAELMPWSAKAQELLRRQYAAVGAASLSAMDEAVEALAETAGRDEQIAPLLERFRSRREMAALYRESYRRYCWTVSSVDDLRLAPFHLLATEGAVHTDKNHLWHMETLARICRAGEPVLMATSYKAVDVADASSCDEGVKWWMELTSKGGEGMVVKPMDFIAHGKRGLIQPAVKCRGREYLRIIYGPEYSSSENLDRLRARRLAGKRSLALREFALGVEALERFIRREPLRQVHSCVLGILAMESEPVDPRL
jgi:protein phosphatase